MATSHSTAIVGTAVSEIVGPSSNSQYVYVQNGDFDGTDEIYIGGAAVGTADGFRVWRDANTVLQIEGGDSLYAISTGTATTVRIIQVEQ